MQNIPFKSIPRALKTVQALLSKNHTFDFLGAVMGRSQNDGPFLIWII